MERESARAGERGRERERARERERVIKCEEATSAAHGCANNTPAVAYFRRSPSAVAAV